MGWGESQGEGWNFGGTGVCRVDAPLGAGIEGAQLKKVYGPSLLQELQDCLLEQHLGCNQGCLVKKGGLVADEGNHIVHASGGALDPGMICVVLLKVILVDGYVDGTANLLYGVRIHKNISLYYEPGSCSGTH